jgi:hypothetical protein
VDWLHIVRIRCEPLSQRDFFDKPRSATSIISDAIRERPTAEVGRGSEWHIGTTEMIDEDGLIFQMGRVRAVTTPQFDETALRFFEADGERAPFTWAVYDMRNQVCGILRRNGVSLSANEISSKLQILLNSTAHPKAAGYQIVVDPIPDPLDFIEQIREASQVVKFSFTAEFENPFDVEELIQRPAERFNEAVGGVKTKVEVEGDDLNRQVLEELSRAVAATGDDAAASIRPEGGGRAKRIYLRGTPLQEPVDPHKSSNPFIAMLRATRDAYDRIRNAVT